jgi:hypothetical protein
VAGSATGADVAKAELWNGSSWTEQSDLNTGRYDANMSGASGTSVIYFGGNANSSPDTAANTESWDGSSWTEVNDLATGRRALGRAGSSTSALAFGGEDPSSNATEEWAFSGIQPTDPAVGYADAIIGDFYYNSTTGQFKQVNDGGAPTGSWASGGALNTSRNSAAGVGTQNAAMVFGGNTPPFTAVNEQYDGSSWTEVADLNTARKFLAGVGTQTSALAGAGQAPGVDQSNAAETWNGSAWTSVSNVNTGRRQVGGMGSSGTSGYVVSGVPSSPLVEFWNGSSWTEGADVNEGVNRITGGTAGPPSAGIKIGGQTPPGTPGNSELWNGTAWTSSASTNTARMTAGTSGDSNKAVYFGGANNAETTMYALTEGWDGTSFTEVADMATARNEPAPAMGGTNILTLGAGGTTTTTDVANTEEWTGVDFQIKSVTTS